MSTFECRNFPSVLQSKLHCQKCGRRSRTHHKHVNHRRVKSEQRRCRYSQLFGTHGQQRFFPKEFPSYSVVTQTNDNHSQHQPISKNIHRRRSSSKSSQKSVLIDQFIQVQQLDPTKCATHNRSNTSNIQTFRNTKAQSNLNNLQRAQQMIYLRENINNLTYCEHHFTNEYIILKRLEEKNHLINQNRSNVDQYLRPFKLQYQTMSMLLQNTTITSFTYSKSDPYETTPNIKTPFKRCPFSEHNQTTSIDIINRSSLASEQSRSSTNETPDTIITDKSLVKQADNLTTTDPTDSLTILSPYNEYKQLQQHYSQNAAHSNVRIDHTAKTRKEKRVFDTAVIIDVTKCPQIIPVQADLIPQALDQNNWTQIQSTVSEREKNNHYVTSASRCISFLNNNQQESPLIYIPHQPIYCEQYPQAISLPWPQNSNYAHQQQIPIDINFRNPVYNESPPNVSHETTCFSPDFHHLYNNIFPADLPSLDLTSPSSSTHQILASEKSLSFTNTDTVSNTSTTKSKEIIRSTKYTQTIHKIKEILNALQKNLLHRSTRTDETVKQPANISFPSRHIIPSNMNQTSISTTMTSDSLISDVSIQTTYSVSSTLPISNKSISWLPCHQVALNDDSELLQIEFDSLNRGDYSTTRKSQRILLNHAKNINTNQQTCGDDGSEKSFHYTRTRSRRSRSRRISVQHMSSSFMFVLQILLATCLLNRLLRYYFFGNVPIDGLTSVIVNNPQSVTSIPSLCISKTKQTVVLTNQEIFNHVLSSLFSLIG